MKTRIPIDIHEIPKALLVGVQAPYNTSEFIDSYFQEFVSLAHTNGITNYEVINIKLRSIDNKYFFTKGKLEEIKKIFDESGAKSLYISDAISGQQEKSLQDLFDCTVYDRTKLILSIFEKSAVTAEGKIQVEIAQQLFKKTHH